MSRLIPREVIIPGQVSALTARILHSSDRNRKLYSKHQDLGNTRKHALKLKVSSYSRKIYVVNIFLIIGER